MPRIAVGRRALNCNLEGMEPLSELPENLFENRVRTYGAENAYMKKKRTKELPEFGEPVQLT